MKYCFIFQKEINTTAFYQFIETSGRIKLYLEMEDNTSLIFAIRCNNTNWAKNLIENGGNVNQLDSEGMSPLQWAIVKENYDIFNLLVQNNANLDFTWDKEKYSLLFQATALKKPKFVELLIKHGANVNVVNTHNATPLHAAADIGAEDIVEILLRNFAKLDAKNNMLDTPIFFAASRGHNAILEMLLRNGATVNIENIEKKQPLHFAANMDHLQSVELLMKYGANVNAKDKDDVTPIHEAIEIGNFDVVRALINHGANIHLRNIEENTPFENVIDFNFMDKFKAMIFLNHVYSVN